MPTLPAWYPDPDERKPAPQPLLLVQAFVNTCHLEEQTDLLGDPGVAAEWLAGAGLLPEGTQLARGDLDLARTVRASIRGLLGSNDDGGGGMSRSERLAALRSLADHGHPRLTIDDEGLLAVENSRHEHLTDGLFELLLIIRASQDDGTWERLRACANPECRWVFYDRSRNRQGNWCDMAVCGNRLKNRTLRERRR